MKRYFLFLFFIGFLFSGCNQTQPSVLDLPEPLNPEIKVDNNLKESNTPIPNALADFTIDKMKIKSEIVFQPEAIKSFYDDSCLRINQPYAWFAEIKNKYTTKVELTVLKDDDLDYSRQFVEESEQIKLEYEALKTIIQAKDKNLFAGEPFNNEANPAVVRHDCQPQFSTIIKYRDIIWPDYAWVIMLVTLDYNKGERVPHLGVHIYSQPYDDTILHLRLSPQANFWTEQEYEDCWGQDMVTCFGDLYEENPVLQGRINTLVETTLEQIEIRK